MPEWRMIFPEIEWISDRDLAEKVGRVWELAYKKGGWKAEDISVIPFTLLVGETSVTLVEHTRLVVNICRGAADVMKSISGIEIDQDTLLAGALLHDVGKLLEYERTENGFRMSKSGKLLRHPLSGMALAAAAGLPEEVYHIIAVHSREGDGSYRSPEAVILHHADFTAFETVKASVAAAGKK